MANKFWVGGTGNTNNANSWAASSGGAPGAGFTAGDNANVDANSGGGTITVNAAFAPHSWDFTGTPAVTVAGGSGITIGGQAVDTSAAVFTLTANVTWSATSNITFDQRSGGLTVVTAGVSFNSSGTWTSGANNSGGVVFSDTPNIGVTNWTINRGAHTFSTGLSMTGILTVAGGGVKSIVYNGVLLDVGGWVIGGTVANCTITGNSTSTIRMIGSGTFTGAGKTYPGNGLTISAAGALATMSDTNTFNNFTWTGSNEVSSLDLAATTVTSVLTLTGASNLAYGNVFSGTNVNAAAVTITVNGSVSLTNVTFRGITAAGSAGTWTGANIGDRGGLTSITATSPVTRYWVGGSSNGAWSSLFWATSSGGSPTGVRAPLPQDTAVFDNTGMSGSRTVTLNGTWYPGVDSSALTTPTLLLQCPASLKVAVVQQCGNISLGPTTTMNGNNGSTTSFQLYKPGSTLTIAMVSGALLQCLSTAGFRVYSNVTVTTPGNFGSNVWSVLSGTFDLSAGDQSIGPLRDTGSAGVTITLGAGRSYSLFGGGDIFNFNTSGSVVNGASGATFRINNTGTANFYLTSNASATPLTIGCLWLESGNQLTTVGSGTINILALNSGAQFKGTSGTTITVGDPQIVGEPSVISISAVTPGSAFTLSKATGHFNCVACTVQDVTGTGGATFFFGNGQTNNSTNVSGNTGLTFSSGPARTTLGGTGAGR